MKVFFQKDFTEVLWQMANSNLVFYFIYVFIRCTKRFWCSDLLESSFISFGIHLRLKEGINILQCNKENLCAQDQISFNIFCNTFSIDSKYTLSASKRMDFVA